MQGIFNMIFRYYRNVFYSI